MLEVFGLRKEFRSTVAVDDLTFKIGTGQVCGFVGPNGAGKTTTMRMIATLETPTRGDIRLDGKSIFDDPYKARRSMGFMPDHMGIYPDLSVEDYLYFYARAYDVAHTIRRTRVEDVMIFTDLDKIRTKKVETLSKGMRQRLNLGRALLNDPTLLIMDEPAAGLDPRARVEFRELVKSLAKQGKTIFISSHILTELGEMCDAMLIIQSGCMISGGTVDQIKQSSSAGTIVIGVRLVGVYKEPDRPPVPDFEVTAKLEGELMERKGRGIVDVTNDGRGVLTVKMQGLESDASSLLKHLVNAGYPILEFVIKSETMEDLFMRLTKEGEVQ